MDIDTLQSLKSSPLFKKIDDSEIIHLMHTVRYRVIRYKKGEFFCMAGDTCQHADIILKGEMVARVVSPSGRTMSMNLHHAGNMLAPAFLFAADNHYPVTVEALEETSVLRLTSQDMVALLHANEQLMMNFVSILSNIVAFLTKQVTLLNMSVREKVCLYLANEMRRQGSTAVTLTVSRQMLAEQLGMQKYSLLRCLNELQQEGVIRIDQKRVDILRPQELVL